MIIMPIVPKRKHSKARKNKRRSNVWKIDAPTLTICSKCGKYRIEHRVCRDCGFYDGKKVVDVKA
jgi:large subunit ribosomal protein L32